MTKEDFLAGKFFQRKNDDPDVDMEFEAVYNYKSSSIYRYFNTVSRTKYHATITAILDDCFIACTSICGEQVHAKIYFKDCVLVEQEVKP